jgi:hypothetical protein
MLSVSSLEREWDFDTGFFGLLRRGEFDPESFNRLVETLGSTGFDDDKLINRRAVSLLWYMPLFMSWQRERVQENGGDLAEFDNATTLVQNLVEGILGVP